VEPPGDDIANRREKSAGDHLLAHERIRAALEAIAQLAQIEPAPVR
jgi:hypothetical protein